LFELREESVVLVIFTCDVQRMVGTGFSHYFYIKVICPVSIITFMNKLTWI